MPRPEERTWADPVPSTPEQQKEATRRPGAFIAVASVTCSPLFPPSPEKSLVQAKAIWNDLIGFCRHLLDKPLLLLIYPILWAVVATIILLLILSMVDVLNRDFAVIFATLLVGLATFGVIFWQGSLLKQQIQFQTYMDLEDEWNSGAVPKAREDVAKAASEHTPIYVLETVLEFLEKFALFKKRNALDREFILSSNIGWYAVRYFYYYKTEINTISKCYRDLQLYELLEELYIDYIKWDGANQVEFEKDLDETKRQFLQNEARN